MTKDWRGKKNSHTNSIAYAVFGDIADTNLQYQYNQTAVSTEW